MINYFRHNKLKLAALIVTGEVIVGQSLRLISNLILTRLLLPEMFGVMMIAMVFLVGITMLSNLGLREKFIQSPNSSKQEFIDTCWSMQVVRGGLITFIVLLIASLLYFLNSNNYIDPNSSYSNSELPFILAVIGFTALVNGFYSVSIFDHYRNMRLYLLAKMSLISQVLGTLTMLLVACFYREIWVLLISPVLTALIKLYLSYFYSGRMKAAFKFDTNCTREILSFSKWIFIGSVLTYISMNADRLILGGLLSAEQLGVFSVAFMLAMAANDLFSRIIKSVAYPKLSKVVRESPDKLYEVMYSLRLKIDFITWSAAGFLLGFGSVIVMVLYDSRYSQAGWMLEILSVSLLFVGFNVSQHALMALGKSFSYAFVNFVGSLYIVVAIPLAYYYFGIELVMFVIATKAVSSAPFLFYLQFKYGLFSFLKELRMAPVFLITFVIGYYLKQLVIYLWM